LFPQRLKVANFCSKKNKLGNQKKYFKNKFEKKKKYFGIFLPKKMHDNCPPPLLLLLVKTINLLSKG
jgi:hypothetical protein